MEEKDKIKELFENRFESFEAKVDPQLWSGIESQIGSVPSSSWVSGVSNTLLGSAAVGVLTVGAFVGYLNYTPSSDENLSSPVTENMQLHENGETPIKSLEEEGISINEESEDYDDSQESIHDKPQTVNALENEKADEKVLVDQGVRNTKPEKSVVLEKSQQGTSISATSVDVSSETNVISKAPSKIVVEEQSKVSASPSGGMAPLEVSFSPINDVVEVKWKFDDGTESSELNPTHEFEKPGIYFVTMLAKLSDGTVAMDKAIIEVKAPTKEMELATEESSIFIPNIFTPNGDGENDELKVVVEGIHSYSISIYSVNGKLVYQSEDASENWDGQDFTGASVEDGTYYYLINALGDDGKVYTPKGYLTIRRN